MPHKIFSFFSGAGLLDLGFEHEGYHVCFFNESHEPFRKAYEYSRKKLGHAETEYGHWPGSITDFYSYEYNSILQVAVEHSRRDGSLVGFIGGPPCPDFSVGGKNRGRHGDNGKLSQTYIDLVCQQRPDFFLFENVKGLWKTKVHREFYTELKALLWQMGYITTERLINSIEYGAPQDRERVILLGFREEIFAGGNHQSIKDAIGGSELRCFPWTRFATYSGRSAFEYPWPETTPFAEGQELAPPQGIPKELTVEHWFEQNDVENHPNAEHSFQPKAGLMRFQTVAEGDVSKKSFKRLHRWRYSPTAAYGNNEVHLHPYKSRRISVAEALAIQSLPPEFELPPDMTLSNMFKTVGNGVPYLAARMLARSINHFLEDPPVYVDCIGARESDLAVTTQPGLQLHQ